LFNVESIEETAEHDGESDGGELGPSDKNLAGEGEENEGDKNNGYK